LAAVEFHGSEALLNNTGENDLMKKELFRELQKSMEQALAHSKGKITLRTKRVPVPKKVTALAPEEVPKLRKRLGAER
jgi:hypothetical protein